MRQKMVIEVSMRSTTSRAKAMAVSGGFPGVLSVKIQGENLGYIEIEGDGIDAVKLTKLLRTRLRHAELVSVTPVISVADQGGGYWRNQEYRGPETNSNTAEPQPNWYPYNGGVSHNYTTEPQPIWYPYNGGVSHNYTTEPQPIWYPYNDGVSHNYTAEQQPMGYPYNGGVSHNHINFDGFNDYFFGQDDSTCSLM